MPSHILPEVYTWELKLNLIQGFHQYEVTLESRIYVPRLIFQEYSTQDILIQPPPPRLPGN